MRARLLWILSLSLLMGCGGGSDVSNRQVADATSSAAKSASTPQHFLVIQASGIEQPVTLHLKNGDTTQALIISINGATRFHAGLVLGAQYQIAIASSTQACELNTDSINVISAPVNEYQLTCKPRLQVGLKGRLQLDDAIIFDSSLNDANALFVDNMRSTSPQDIPANAKVLGFVNATGTGSEDTQQRFAQTPNPDDFYRVSLRAGQQISLTQIGVFDASQDADVDLFVLRESDYQLIGSDQSAESSATLTVSHDDVYLLQVYAHTGSASYQLHITAPIPVIATTGGAAAIVPGEAIVALEPTPLALALNHASITGSAIERRPVRHKLNGRNPSFGIGVSSYSAAKPVMTEVDTLIAIKHLNQQPGVRYAEPNFYRQIESVGTAQFTLASDPYRDQQWALDALQLPGVDNFALNEVIVAVIDTGLLLDHPEFTDRLEPGFDFVADPSNAGDGDGIDANPAAVYNPTGNSNAWHATHVAGIIAANANNGEGIHGIAPNARIMPLRVIGLNGGTSYDLAQAIRYAAGLSNDSGRLPARQAQIINMSVGGYGATQTEQETIAAAAANGVVLVASGGNRGTDVINYPAGYRHVLSVTALTDTGDRADYANFGSTIDLAAPGGSPERAVLSSYGSYDASTGRYLPAYAYMYGTSMAAPQVSGVIALMLGQRPELTPATIEQWLQAGLLTDATGDGAFNPYYGYGKLNATKAWDAALKEPLPTPSVASASASPRVLHLAMGQSQVLNVLRTSGSDIRVTHIESDQPWLTTEAVTPQSRDETWLASFTVRVDWAQLSSGLHKAQLHIELDAAPSIVVPVTVERVEAAPTAIDVPVYVQLHNDHTSYRVRAEPNPQNPLIWQFEFSGIPVGRYQICAGTDINANGIYCEPGELFAQYQNLSATSWLTLEADGHNEVSMRLNLEVDP